MSVPFEFDRPVAVSAAFLRSAERRLLEVHRADVARLLFEAAHRSLWEHPSASAQFHHSLTVDRQLELADPVEWQRRAEAQLRESPSELREDATHSLLHESVRWNSDSRPSTLQLAAASLRLQPRVESRMMLALALQQVEQRNSALNLLHNVVANGASHLLMSCAWENIGLCEWEAGRIEASLDAYQRASTSLEARSAPLMNWLILALKLERRDSALRAAARLGELVDEDHPSVDEFIAANRARRRNGSWVVAEPARRLARSIEDGLPAVAKKVTDAAFQ